MEKSEWLWFAKTQSRRLSHLFGRMVSTETGHQTEVAAALALYVEERSSR